MAVVAYAMVTVLFILTPDYIYGNGKTNVETHVKAEKTHQVAPDIVEETTNEVIVRFDQVYLNSQFILCDLTTDGTPVESSLLQKQSLAVEGGNNTYSVTDDKNDSHKETEKDKITAEQADAETMKKVDSGSTKENSIKETKSAVSSTAKEQETESKKKAEEAKVAKEAEEKKADEKQKESDKKKDYVIDLNEEEIEILQRIVEAEATGEDIKGKMLVANVILNRVNNKSFPNTVKGVVFQKNGNTYQFSPTKDGRYWSVKISKDTKKAVERVLQGEDYSKGALYFSARSRADKNSMRWFDRNLEFLFQYGGHEFFR
jgi:N-acetylmuramoyl-L-alanine amidase